MYKITETTDVCNAGANTNVLMFDNFYELQDYVEEKKSGMDEDEAELYIYYLRVEEV